MALTLAYTAAGNWPQTWVPRWVAQIAVVAALSPVCAFIVALLAAGGGFAEVVGNPHRMAGFAWIAGTALVVGLVLALGALVREREAQARAQALQFELERSLLARQALDAQLKLLHAQIEPHFLFNSLANVQALVESGSPRAAAVLRSLISYLKAAVPRLRDEAATLGQELELARSYLELMHLRMPDRLHYELAVPDALQPLRFPAMALLTLVENAVRHGIDPSEQGGRIEIGARREGLSLRVWVADSGVGLDENAAPGTGLANLRQRLAALYGAPARLELQAGEQGGLRAEIVLPLSEPGP